MNDDPSKPYFVYVLVDPRCGTVRKVGITQKSMEQRIKHIVASKIHGFNRHAAWVSELYSLGLRPKGVVIYTLRSKKAALAVERAVSIALRVAGVPIVNGEGEARTRDLLADAS